MAVSFFDYCEVAYCSEVAYAGGRAEDGAPSQVNMIVNKQTAQRTQVQQLVSAQAVVNAQVLQQIEDEELAANVQVAQFVVSPDDDLKLHSQVQQIIAASGPALAQVLQKVVEAVQMPTQVMQYVVGPDDDFKLHAQVDMQLDDTTAKYHAQIQGVVTADKTTPAQVAQFIVGPDDDLPVGTQVMQYRNDAPDAAHMSVLNDQLAHYIRPAYCTDPYCGDVYCTEKIEAHPRTQVAMFNKVQEHLPAQVAQNIISPDDDYKARTQVAQHIIAHEAPQHTQVAQYLFKQIRHHTQLEQIIEATRDIPTQVRMVIYKTDPRNAQVFLLRGMHVPAQVTNVIYNTRRLRFMDVFPSRGTQALGGNNWTSTPTQLEPDLSPNNVNTDVPEQVFRSPAGSSAFVSLTCDTGLAQGVFLDTLAILNHNMTKGASIALQGSNDSFGTVDVNIPLTVTLQNMIYIAPSLPNVGYRYWRLNIVDAFNPDGYIEIGIVLFGASKIFTMLENFVNPLVHGMRDFKDVIPTEGFSPVTNDRALRNFLKLQFADLDYRRSNYLMLNEVFKSARTSSKVLWIPTPQTPERYAVFGKLVQLPEMTISNNDETGATDYVSLSIEIDESI